MKILIACNRDSYKNPFVSTLADGIIANGLDVTCSIDEFWNNWQSYDIIHLQWPNLLIKGLHSIEPLANHLKLIKATGKNIVVTVHNLKPHYCKKDHITEAYDVVYNHASCFVHMGEFSIAHMSCQYPNAKHVIIPHHTYDTLYTQFPSRQEACNKLHLDEKKKYILCFGVFRNDEEREIAKIANSQLKDKNYRVIAPGLVRFTIRKNPWITLRSFIHCRKKIKQYPGFICNGKFITDNELPYYYAVSDIALIQRKDILNSGNLPMAFMMGKVVVGPNCGNVGAILKETGNPTFEPNDLGSVITAIIQAESFAREKGKENKEYAQKNFSLSHVCSMYKDLYQTLLNN